MSDNIDIPIEASGDDGVNRLTSAIDRLNESMTSLGENTAAGNLAKQMEQMQGAMNTALGALTSQMADMKQVLATGFADISATNQKLIEGMGASQARAIQEGGDKSATAMKEANAKLLAVQQADARTILQASRGLSGNVENAFAQMAAGISPETVRQRFGEIATETAKGFKTIDDMMQFRANAKSVKTTAYDPRRGATEAEINQARAMNASIDTQAAEAAAARQRQVDEQSLALKWRNMLELDARETAEKETQAARWRSIDEASDASKWRNFLDLASREDAEKASQAARWRSIDEASQASSWLNYLQIEKEKEAEQAARAARWAQMDEASQASSWLNFLQIERQKEAEEAARAARWRQLDESAQASSWMNFLDIEAKKEAAEAQRIARARALQEQSDASAWRNFLDIEAKKVAEAERNARMNASFKVASPTSQIQTQMSAVAYASEGLDPGKLVGTEAAAAAAGKSLAGLRMELAALRATQAEGAASQYLLTDATRQVESAFRGAAHEAGVYGLAHGQLIALLAGGGMAAALHHIAETGAEVQFQLASFPALAGNVNSQPVDMNRFIGITAGTMTSLKDAAEGMHALAQAGRTQQEAFIALPAIMQLAQLGEMSVAQAAEMAVESMHAFGKSVTDIEHIGDVLVAVGSKSNVSVATLANDMKSAAVTGQMFNATMEETAATVGVLAERGLTIQPLSSALMKLYEPSAKVAKAMQDLGLTTKDSAGNLKEYTQFMGELAQTVSQFKVPADILKDLGMSSRDIKAMQVMTQSFHEYKDLAEEAGAVQGKMFDATLVKMDTSEGAWKRLGSTVDGSLTKAFENAQPAIQGVEEALIRITGNDSTVTLLTRLAEAAANLSKELIDNAGALGMLAAAYVGMRVITNVIEWVVELEAAEKARTVAAKASAAANVTQTESLILLADGSKAAATGTVALGEGSAIAATGMTEAALGAKALTSALGWIGVVLVTATTAYELFMSKQVESDANFQKAINTADTSIDMYDKEIDRLQKLEEQLLKTGKAGVDAANEVATANLEFELGKAKADVAKYAYQKDQGVSGPAVSEFDIRTPSELEQAQARVDQLQNELATRDQRATQVDALRDRTSSLQNINDLHSKIDGFDPVIFPSSKTKEAREAADAANTLLQHLRSTVIAETNYNEVKKEELDLEKLIAATKKDAPAAAGKNLQAGADISALQEQLRLRQMLVKSENENDKSSNKRGELGDLQLINAELKRKQELDNFAITIAEREKTIAAASGAKPKQLQGYQNKVDTAKLQLKLDDTAAERQIADLLDKMDGLELTARAKVLESKGQLEDAYNLTYQAKNANMLANLAKDIADSENKDYRDRLVRYQQYLEDQHRIEANHKRFTQSQNKFGDINSDLTDRLDAIKSQSGPGTGLSSIVGNTFASRDAYAELLPQLKAAQIKVGALSSGVMGGSEADRKTAENDLKVLQDRAAQMRNVFVDLGNTIAKSLADAFGKGGTALGGMITTATAYDAKMKDIQATLDASGHTDADKKKAADDTAAAQIKSYGDMAGAAKGFFDVNSNGYKIMAGAEKAYRVIELAMAAEAFMKKVGFKTAEVTTTVAADSVKVASGTAATAVDVANAGVSGTAWGITAVARAIASMPFPLNLVAGAATMAAIVALGVKMTGGSFGGGGDTAAERQAANGTGTIAGDPTAKSDSIAKSLANVDKNTYDGLTVSQGMLNALQAIESNIGNFAGYLVQTGKINPSNVTLNSNNGFATTMVETVGIGVIGLAIAKVIPGLNSMIGKIATAVFGGKQTLNDDGFTLGRTTLGQVASQGANAQTYQDVTTSGGWFRSDSHNTNLSSVGADANRAITQILTGIGDTVKQSAAILGISGSAFDAQLNSFVIDLGKISLKGLSAADQQTAINNAFSKIGDEMATSAVATISQFSKAGEGALETLTRVANDYQTVDAVFASYGATFSQVGVSSIAARENLIELAGGLDKFTSQADFFSKNFLTAGQQTAAKLAQISPTLAQYGLSASGPNAMQQFANTAIAFGAMGDAGAQAYTDLMRIAPAFKDITDAAKTLQDQIDQLTLSQQQQTAAARAQLDPANQALFDQLQTAKAVSQARSDLVSAYGTESQALQSAVDRLKSFSTTLHNFVNSLQIGTLSTLNPTDKYGAATAQFNDTLAKAQGGDTTAQGNLQAAAQAFLQASRDANASNSTYAADYQRVVTATAQMADWADSQVTEGQASLVALHDVVSQLTTLNGSTLSVVDAINNLNIAMSGNNSKSANDTAISTLYQELLGRAPSQLDLAQGEQSLAAGNSLASIADSIEHTVEYLTRMSTLPATQPVTPSLTYDTTTPNQTLSGGSWGHTIIRSTSGNPTTQAPVTATTPDPYTAMVAQNAQMAALLAQTNAQLAALRQEQQVQADQQVSATMTAGANTGDQVATAVTDTAQYAAWSQQNTMELR